MTRTAFAVLRTFFAILVVVLVLPSIALAQMVSGAATNPLMRLMVPQVPVDTSAPVEATATFDPPMVRVGDKAVLRITFSAIESSIQMPPYIPPPRGMTLELRANGQVLQPTPTNSIIPFTTFMYEARASRPGFFTTPSFVAMVYGRPVIVPEADLEAVQELPPGVPTLRQLLVECDSTNVYFGESLNVRVLTPPWPGNTIQALNFVEFKSEGFLASKNPVRQSVQVVERNGRRYNAFIYETIVTPIASGQLPLSAQAFTAGRQFNGPITIQGNVVIPGGPPQYELLDSEPITINVRPVPVDGQLPGFTGAVGTFSCDPPQLDAVTVRVGNPVQLTIVVRTDGDLSKIIAPPPPRDTNWQVFPATPAGIVVGSAPNGLLGTSFKYTLIPISDEATATPAIPFSAFDPRTRTYTDLTIPPAPIKVTSDGLPTEQLPPTDFAGVEPDTERKLTLSAIAQSPGRGRGSFAPLQTKGWFLAFQLVLANVFFIAWVYDQRRRYLEQHPEIVLRQRARRQLHRQKRLLRRAAAKGDVPAYANYSVSALQTACAPHYPAEPQALVCGDILPLLDEADRQGRCGNTVRELFAATDGSRFSGKPANHSDLLALKSDLDDVLCKLEEKL